MQAVLPARSAAALSVLASASSRPGGGEEAEVAVGAGDPGVHDRPVGSGEILLVVAGFPDDVPELLVPGGVVVDRDAGVGLPATTGAVQVGRGDPDHIAPQVSVGVLRLLEQGVLGVHEGVLVRGRQAGPRRGCVAVLHDARATRLVQQPGEGAGGVVGLLHGALRAEHVDVLLGFRLVGVLVDLLQEGGRRPEGVLDRHRPAGGIDELEIAVRELFGLAVVVQRVEHCGVEVLPGRNLVDQVRESVHRAPVEGAVAVAGGGVDLDPSTLVGGVGDVGLHRRHRPLYRGLNRLEHSLRHDGGRISGQRGCQGGCGWKGEGQRESQDSQCFSNSRHKQPPR